MKEILFFIFFIISVAVQAQIETIIPPKPPVSEGLVIDKTKTLTAEQESYLEQKLVAYDDSTSNQVAVVIIPTTKSYSIEDVALGILRNWGVGGQADKDNGIVLLIAKDDRKVRIEVGYGLEGAISDYVASTIIETDLVPNFKEGNYYRGIDDAINSIMEAAAGRYTAPENYRDGNGISGWVIFLVILITWILIGILSGRGKGGGGYVSRRGSRGWLGPTWTGSGGWSGGGGSWSGGGGGFGGFGGGSGGGGGASGSW